MEQRSNHTSQKREKVCGFWFWNKIGNKSNKNPTNFVSKDCFLRIYYVEVFSSKIEARNEHNYRDMTVLALQAQYNSFPVLRNLSAKNLTNLWILESRESRFLSFKKCELFRNVQNGFYKSFSKEEVWRRIGKSDEAGTSISFRAGATGYC